MLRQSNGGITRGDKAAIALRAAEICLRKPACSPSTARAFSLPELRHVSLMLKAARAKLGNLCRFRPLRLRISKKGISYDREQRNPF